MLSIIVIKYYLYIMRRKKIYIELLVYVRYFLLYYYLYYGEVNIYVMSIQYTLGIILIYYNIGNYQQYILSENYMLGIVLV